MFRSIADEVFYRYWAPHWDAAKKNYDLKAMREALKAGFIPKRGLDAVNKVQMPLTDKIVYLPMIDILLTCNRSGDDIVFFNIANDWHVNKKIELPKISQELSGDYDRMVSFLQNPRDLFLALKAAPAAVNKPGHRFDTNKMMTMLHMLPLLGDLHQEYLELNTKLIREYSQPDFKIRDASGKIPIEYAVIRYKQNPAIYKELLEYYVRGSQACGIDVQKYSHGVDLSKLSSDKVQEKSFWSSPFALLGPKSSDTTIVDQAVVSSNLPKPPQGS